MYENVYCEEIKDSVGIISNYEEVKEYNGCCNE